MQNGNVDVFDLMEILSKPVAIDILLITDVIHTVRHFQKHRPHILDQRKEKVAEVIGVVGDFLRLQF